MSTRIKILVPAVLLLSVAIPAHAIERVASRFGALEIRFGYAMPLGEYDGLPGLDFIFEDSARGAELVDFDAERVFDDGFAFGFSYGQILAGRWRASIGFDYARHDVKNPIIQQIGDYQYSIAFPDDVSYNQYGLSFRVAYAPTDLHRQGWSPFVRLRDGQRIRFRHEPGFWSRCQTLGEPRRTFVCGALIDQQLELRRHR
jgi:hypothetical protein